MHTDHLLIRAAVDPPQQAMAAWRDWSKDRDFGSLSNTELRLLPLVYRHLTTCGMAVDEIAPVAKQMYRSTWIRNRLLFRQIETTLQTLREQSIEAVLIKGAALIAGYYHDTGVRPMLDFDLLVRREQTPLAMATLQQAGWIPDKAFDTDACELRHSAGLRKEQQQCDLHWRALSESAHPVWDERCITDAVSSTLENLPVLIPRPESQLIHSIIHGTRKYEVGTSRWIVDTLTIIRDRPGLDWDMLAVEIRDRNLQYPVGDALEYLRHAYGAMIPIAVINDLKRARVSRLQRATYRIGAGDAKRSMLRSALYYLYLGMRHSSSALSGTLWSARYLQYTLDVEQPRQVPRAVARRVTDKLKRRFSGDGQA